jgi:hypothetical protein
MLRIGAPAVRERRLVLVLRLDIGHHQIGDCFLFERVAIGMRLVCLEQDRIARCEALDFAFDRYLERALHDDEIFDGAAGVGFGAFDASALQIAVPSSWTRDHRKRDSMLPG